MSCPSIVWGFIEIGTNFDRGKYPVLDPRRTAGPGPFRYGYNLAADGITVVVARDSSLSHCEMRVDLVSTLAEPKDILAWSFSANADVDRIGSPGLGLPTSMTIRKSCSMGLGPGQGADTVILRRRDAAFGNWTPWYWFPVQDFWDFWGGCNVTFDWFSDTNRGLWGDQTSPPSYPLVGFPDGTLMVDSMGSVSVVFGGTDFAVPPYLLRVWVPTLIEMIPYTPLPSIPTDFTLVRELFTSEVYVIYGGAGFPIPIPDPPTFAGLGLTGSQVRTLPPGGTAKLRQMPIDGTLLQEQHNSTVYLVENQELRRVTSTAAMDGRCLPRRHVRIVPDDQLGGLKMGSDLGPP